MGNKSQRKRKDKDTQHTQAIQSIGDSQPDTNSQKAATQVSLD